MALHSTGKQAHFPNYNNSLYNRERIAPSVWTYSMKHEHWKQQQIFYQNSSHSFTSISSEICGRKQLIRSLKTLGWLYDSFGVMFQCTIYGLAMLWEILLLLVDLVCGMWVGTLQHEKTTTCSRLLLGSYVMKRYNHSQYIRTLHWNFSMDMWQKNQGIEKGRGFTFHKKKETNSPRSISAMRVIHTHL